ncbi:ubiquitin carboxyl-terminal hydrolase isozyme L1 [Babesia ovis]|uniref:Ubiquitin carboxyl-terminal hydrolase n=1 Tax=Babesia ovis TaxID=5869 RepID=A0A9W5WVN1_BABOV|nr:ubiquitin carboxyl-terminal hydrolase isozyme L1 [Babesia ovis]
MRNDFAPLEACPEVFDKYAKELGQNNVVFQDLLAWEEWAYDQLAKPVVGVIVTIPLTSKICHFRDTDARYTASKKFSPNVWFARQNLRNTCGTVALLHLLNNINEKVALSEGSILEQMRKKTLRASPAERGALIEKTDHIKDLHTTFESQGQSSVRMDDVDNMCHYITFVIVDGELYELDGTLKYPVNHGETAPKDLLNRVEEIVQGTLFALEPDNLNCAAIVASIKHGSEE